MQNEPLLLPTPFITRLQSQFNSDEVARFVAAIAKEPIPSVRTHPVKYQGNLIVNEQIKWCKEGYFLKSKPLYTLDPLFHAGSYYPQDASSLFLNHVLNEVASTQNNPVILDLCAAPGGKSTLIASWLNNNGFLVANEVIKSRAQILKENIIKWGYSNVAVTNNDPSHFAKAGSLFDIVVVDAPCSGEGLFRKDKQAIDEWSLENTNLCTLRQRRILIDAFDALKEDGVLIYSTCTFNPEENEKNIEWLATQRQLEIANISVPNEWNVAEIEILNGKGFGFYPHRVNGEGFFLVALYKRSKSNPINGNSKKQKTSQLKSAPKELILTPELFDFKKINDQIFALPANYTNLIDTLMANFYLVHLGICIGEEMPKGIAPNHSLALSLQRSAFFNAIEVDKTEALKYLKGENNFLIEGQNGWNIITHNNLALGFVKVIQGRFNNYYPKEYRIRMNID